MTEWSFIDPDADKVTLYRVGPLPKEAKEISDRSNMSDWLKDAWEESGGLGASGRWFTSDKESVEWYKTEHPGYSIRSVEVDKSQAEQWFARDHATARNFASQPEHEYFVPEDVANSAKIITPDPSFWRHSGEAGMAPAVDQPRQEHQEISYGMEK
jgi:hypothetical protein